MKLIHALLASSAGPKIRAALHLHAADSEIGNITGTYKESIYTELVYVKLKRIREGGSCCSIRAVLGKFENGEFSKDALEIVFQCLDISALEWRSSFADESDVAEISLSESEIEIDTEDSFRIICRSIEILSVVLCTLGNGLEKENGA